MIEDVEGYDNNKIYIKLGSFLEIDEVQLFVKIGEDEYKKVRKKMNIHMNSLYFQKNLGQFVDFSK